MIKRTLAVAFAAMMVLALNSCEKKKTTESGLEYQFLIDAEGALAKEGDFMTLNLIVRNDKDSILDNTYTSGRPVDFLVSAPKFKPSLEEGLTLLSQGDSVDFFVQSDSLFKFYKMPRPPFIKEGSKLRYTVKVEKVRSKAQMEKEQTEKSANQKGVDEQLIKEYIGAKKLTNATRTETGLYYAQTKAGTGKKVAKGDKVKVHYVGKLLTDMEFDSSVKRGQPFELQIGVGQVIPGWDEGLQLMSEGEKGVLLIPSDLGYGPQGTGPIPPNAVLVFEVEMISTSK